MEGYTSSGWHFLKARNPEKIQKMVADAHVVEATLRAWSTIFGASVAGSGLRGSSLLGLILRLIHSCCHTSSMKLSAWAHAAGVRYETAWRGFRQGILPVPAIQLPTGTILVLPPTPAPDGVALYARVSSYDQRGDLDRQEGRLASFATGRSLKVARVVEEVASGLNGHRPKLLALLRDPEVGTLVVEHRDRLARFGSEYVEAALAASGRKVLVMEEGETSDDLVQDMVDVLTSFCARLYGRRSARRRAERALEAARRPPEGPRVPARSSPAPSGPAPSGGSPGPPPSSRRSTARSRPRRGPGRGGPPRRVRGADEGSLRAPPDRRTPGPTRGTSRSDRRASG